MAVLRAFFYLLLSFTALAGCRLTDKSRTFNPEYADLTHSISQAVYAEDPSEYAIPEASLLAEGPHPVEEYIRYALHQNPNIQAARLRVEAAAFQVPVAASLQDPMFGTTIFPEQIQTAAGQQEVSLSISQKLPWHGKLNARAELAESQVNIARTQLATVELATIEKIKIAYYELYFIQQAITVTNREKILLDNIRGVANSRYQTGKTSQQDLLRADLEISNLENDLIRLRQRQESGQARLARILHVSPQTELLTEIDLPNEEIPQDLDWLQRQAVMARPELHAKLAVLERDRHSVNLTKLDFFPDLTLGASWIDVASSGISPVADGQDSFLITAGVNLPIYRKRLSASTRSAEAKAISTAREYDSLRDGTLEEVTDLFAQARSQEQMMLLFREDILPKSRQTLEVSRGAYNVGEVDFLQLIDNWRLLLQYQISYHRLEASIRQTSAKLERVVGGMTSPIVQGDIKSQSGLHLLPMP